MIRRLAAKLLVRENGNVIVITALAFTVLLGFVALATDVGMLFLQQTRMSRAMDAAALAGAQELPNTGQAQTAAREFAQRNEVDLSTTQIAFSADNKQITVSSTQSVDTYFAKVLGFASRNVSARAVARLSPVKTIGSILPIGINEVLLPLTPGEEYMIKAGAHSGVTGWREILEYPGTNGATDYRELARNGYMSTVKIGDIEGQQTGNISGPTTQGIEDRIESCTNGCTWNNYENQCPRVVVVPIYRDLSPQSEVQIVGFASVFLERVNGNGQESEVHARYIQKTFFGETDDTVTNAYLYGVRLVE